MEDLGTSNIRKFEIHDITRIFFYKKRSKRVTSRDFDFLYNFCTVVSYFYRSSVDSPFLLLTNKLCNFRDFFMYETNFGSLKFPK